MLHPMTSPLLVVSTRSGHIESAHGVHAVVVDASGAIVASSSDPEHQAWWRSAAKLIQAIATVEDGAADAFGFDDRALALACGSHSAEDAHVEVATTMLRACGCDESVLACGPHPSLSPAVARAARMRHDTTGCCILSLGMLSLPLKVCIDLFYQSKFGHSMLFVLSYFALCFG